MTKTIMAAVLAATMLAAPAAHAQSAILSGKGIPTISARERQAQQAWWAARTQRHAKRHTVACMAMPGCSDGRMMPAAPSNKG
ncbi:MAG: hypothetical protein P0Y59_10960 [Candidatus Sphingomonas phytovorans]|nr:hypothetical protein [Sphingomonas sp.]WEK02167.1 MAG: hypothetical protein P0Y59_10960 [Sphingomonas sp.]